jgi:iron complex transport system substrate-binding protein
VLFVMGTARPSVHAEGSFVDDLIEIAGGVNAANAIPGNQAWRRATLETIAAANVDVLVVQTAPAKAKQAREYWMQWEDIPAVRNGRVHIVTDDAWMRPTFKLADLAGELADMLYPDRAKGKATREGKDLR